MALQVQVFDQATPAAPTRANGMLLGSSGVSAPPLQSLGSLTSDSSSANGEFSDAAGYGQITYDAAGYMYVADNTNNRVQRFAKDSNGLWVYDSKVSSIGTILGGGVNSALIAVNRNVTPNELHIANWDHYTASNWISVWAVTSWPNLTTLNRLRQYGANASSNIAGRAFQGLSLAIDDTYAVVSSISSPYRCLRWKHTDGTLQNEATKGDVFSRFVSDGAGNWWVSAGASDAIGGIRKIDVSNFTSLARLDLAPVALSLRKNRHWQAVYGNIVYHSGRIYIKDWTGRVWACAASDGSYLDTFLDPGSLETNNTQTGKSGPKYGGGLQTKFNHVLGPNGCSELVMWSEHADNGNSQRFLQCFPMSTATATWTKTTWGPASCTMKRIAVQGTHLAAEKCKVRLRKNSEAWVTVTFDKLCDEATLATLGTFTGSDVLTFEANLSGWDRQDGHSTLVAVRDHIPPTNVSFVLLFEDPDQAGIFYTPYQTSVYRAKAGFTAAFKAKIGG